MNLKYNVFVNEKDKTLTKIVGYYKYIKTGIRLYSNDDIVLLTSLKVASRFCDDYFYNNDLNMVTEVFTSPNGYVKQIFNIDSIVTDEFAKKLKQEYKYHILENGQNFFVKDNQINDIINGTEKRKIIFLCRHPFERHCATTTHLFTNKFDELLFWKFFKNKNNQSFKEIYDEHMISQYSENIPNLPEVFLKHPNLAISERDMRQLIKHKISKFEIATDWDQSNDAVNKIIEKFSNVLDIIKKYIINYIKYEDWTDQHYSEYIKFYYEFINSNNENNITVIDIDKTNLFNLLKIKDKWIKNSSYKSNPLFKSIVKEEMKNIEVDVIKSEIIFYNKLLNKKNNFIN